MNNEYGLKDIESYKEVREEFTLKERKSLRATMRERINNFETKTFTYIRSINNY